MARARFQKQTKADRIREVLRALPPEKLLIPKVCSLAIKKAGIKAGSSDVYAYRKQVMGIDKAPQNGESPGQDILHRISVVSKAAKAVGGLDSLEETISVIKKVKSVT